MRLPVSRRAIYQILHMVCATLAHCWTSEFFLKMALAQLHWLSVPIVKESVLKQYISHIGH